MVNPNHCSHEYRINMLQYLYKKKKEVWFQQELRCNVCILIRKDHFLHKRFNFVKWHETIENLITWKFMFWLTYSSYSIERIQIHGYQVLVVTYILKILMLSDKNILKNLVSKFPGSFVVSVGLITCFPSGTNVGTHSHILLTMLLLYQC
jgi:hypothetical protein